MNQQKRTIGKLNYTEILQIQDMYRQGSPVFDIVNKYNVELKTVVDIGRGMRTTVYNKNGKAIFNGWAIEADEFCEKNKWSYKVAH
jgi:hypothetical protein